MKWATFYINSAFDKSQKQWVAYDGQIQIFNGPQSDFMPIRQRDYIIRVGKLTPKGKK